MNDIFEFKSLAAEPDYIAPDTSEIRLLPETGQGGLSHCTLPAGKSSKPVRHQTVEEIWFCLSGEGRIWQRDHHSEDDKPFTAGDSFTIPKGNSFQFKNTGENPLHILISTMPRWPGPSEAVAVEGAWKE